MYTQAEAVRVLGNKFTKQLVEWVDSESKTTKVLLSPQFFHKTHSKRDREVICIMLRNFYPGMILERSGQDAVKIQF